MSQIEGFLNQLNIMVTITGEKHKSPRRSLRYYFGVKSIVSVIFLFFGGYFFGEIVLLVLGIIVFFVLTNTAIDYKMSSVSLTDKSLNISKGFFYPNTIYIPWNKIECVDVQSSKWREKRQVESVFLTVIGPSGFTFEIITNIESSVIDSIIKKIEY